VPKTNLTEEEKAKIIEALNENTEPSPELMEKLFPSVAEKFDVVKLDRAKVVTLEYAGKRSEASILNMVSPTDAGSPLQVERYFSEGTLTFESQLDLFRKVNETGDCEWQNLIVQGDNLQFLKTCYQNIDPLIKDKVKGKVKLIYIDPPFATRAVFRSKEGSTSYSDRVDTAEFLENIRERMILMREVLADDGLIVVHIDYRYGHYIKVILDEVFRGGFRNDIKVPRGTKNVQNQFDEITALTVGDDSLLLYSKSIRTKLPHLRTRFEQREAGKWDTFWRGTDRKTMRYEIFGITPDTGQWRWKSTRTLEAASNYQTFLDQYAKNETLDDYYLRNLEAGVDLDFVRLSEEGVVQYYVPPRDSRVASTVWTDVRTLGKETSYPTEKHEDLLLRVVDWLTEAGDLVMDTFAGSGTTGAVAEKTGRRWIVCDFGKQAIYTMQKRMLRIAESKALRNDVKKNQKHGQPPKPFCVVSTGAYDFSRIMKLREYKDAYIDFVLGLFQLSRSEQDLAAKYKLTNIYTEKDGNPVEVYPVWDDEYLKNIRVDEQYLEGIIRQSRRTLKKDYYIITPETCTLVGDLTMPNGKGEKVDFKLLKFPYKILEDVSRNFQIHEQPSSPENVNELINSTGFYFHDQVEIEIKKVKDGLKITRFESKILNKRGERFRALEGLAMLLVDVDSDGELFEVDRTFFLKDIDEKGKVKMSVPKGDIAVIAIDKHGNESKPLILKG